MDTIGLLAILKKVCYKCEAKQFPPLAEVRALMTLIKTKQEEDLQNNIKCYEQFKNMQTVLVACSTDFKLPRIEKYVPQEYHHGTKLEDLTPDISTQVQQEVADITLPTTSIENSNQNRDGIIKQIENSYLMEQENYPPRTLAEPQNLLVNYK